LGSKLRKTQIKATANLRLDLRPERDQPDEQSLAKPGFREVQLCRNNLLGAKEEFD
jgi:hypothetical protein